MTAAQNAAAKLPDHPTMTDYRLHLYTGVVSDALDSLGFHQQSPRVPLWPMTTGGLLMGRCKTTLWSDLYHADPEPYIKELEAVDSCQPDDVLIAACGGSLRGAIWGELLSTAAKNRGCVGAIVDGATRDIPKMRTMGFCVYARAALPYDSKDRQRVTDYDVPVEIDGVRFAPGDLVLADEDGIVVIPRAIEDETLARAWKKIHDENITRDAIARGMLALEAYRKFGVL